MFSLVNQELERRCENVFGFMRLYPVQWVSSTPLEELLYPFKALLNKIRFTVETLLKA